MNKRVKKILSLVMIVCLSCCTYSGTTVWAATNVYVQTMDFDNSNWESPSVVYEVSNIDEENLDFMQDTCEMIYVDHDKIEKKEEIKEASLYQSDSIKYYSDGSSDFFNDCSSNYWFSSLENASAVKDYQTLYMNILNLLKSNYESGDDVSPRDFDGTSYYCIGELNYASLGISSDKLLTIYNYVLYDHPLLFNCKRTIIYDGMNVYLIAAEEFYQGTTRQAYRTNIESAIKDFETLTKDAATNFDIVKIVYDEVVQTLEYGFEEDGVTPLDNGYVHSPASYVHTEKLAVCDGYTCMIQAVLSYLDIENYFVPGTGVDADADEKHAWNLVALGNGKHYFVDATWNDTAKGVQEENYLCFGAYTYAATHDTNAIAFSDFNIPDVDYYTMYYGEWVVNEPDTGIVKVEDPTYVITNICDFVFEDGVLTFSGKGKVLNVESDNPDSNPWQEYKDSVTKIVFNDGITGIDYGMFKDYKNLQTIDFGNTVVFIGDNAFAGCDSLEVVTLPDNVTYYGGGMFDDCTNLTSISFGSTPMNGAVVYASGMFVRTPNLQSISVSENNIIFESVDNVLYDKTRKTLLAYPGGCTDASYTVKEGTEKIMRFAFTNNDDLEEIHFPDSLKVVDTCSFYMMDKLDNVYFPSSVEYFYNVNIPAEKTDGVFHFCHSLRRVTNQSEAICYIGSGYIEDATSISGYRGGYWYSEAQKKYVTTIAKDEAVLREISKPLTQGSTFEIDGVTFKVESWKEELEEFYNTQGSTGLSFVEIINALEETAGYVTIETNSENQTLTCRIPDTVNYQYWNYIVDKESLNLVHELIKTEKKEATCTASGNYAYWTCSACNKKFMDLEATKEITDESTLMIVPAGHTWNEDYTVDRAATATETGSKSIHCKGCGAIKEGSSVVIPRTGTNDTETPPQSGDNTTDTGNPPQSGDNTTDTETPPQKGDTVTDTETKAVYTVTKAGAKTGNVTYVKPTDSKATKVTVPATIQIGGVTYKVTAIANNAFKNNKKITSIIIGKNVTEIGKNAFSGCKNLKTITIGKNVTTIGEKAFYQCTKLKKITIPAKVKKIGANVFKGCKNLKTITIKSKLLKSKTVSKNAFKGVVTKATIKVPKSKLNSYKKLLQSKGLNKKVKIKGV